MIENIKFKSTNPFNNEIKTINFGRVNIIIGPKGGGKTTLFDLLANIENQKIFSTVIETLNRHQLEIVSITKDGENIPFQGFNVEKINKSHTKDDIYKKRLDVIYQDDIIKKDLSSSDDIEKAKMNFATKIVSNSEDVREMISKINTLYSSIYKIVLYDDVPINWSNALKIESLTRSDEQLIFNLNYHPGEVKLKIEELIQFLTEINQHIDTEIKYWELKITHYKNQINNINTLDLNLIDYEYYDISIKKFIAIISSLKEQFKINDVKIKWLRKTKKILDSFDFAYKKLLSEIKRNTETNTKIAAYETHAKSHFQNMAKNLKISNKNFNDVIKNNFILNISENFKLEEKMLELDINEEIKISDDSKFELLKIVLFTPKKVQDDVENWIDAARNNSEDKNFKEDSIIKHLASKVIKDKIKILADGKDYETMSPGQKSAYGIKYKFNYSRGKAIFLDQPEDNLDNNTIATNILELVNSKQEQVFIVTHNANIGILTKPDKVIVACLNDQVNLQNLDQYMVGNIVVDNNKNSETVYYLEGGIRFLEERLNILKGEK